MSNIFDQIFELLAVIGFCTVIHFVAKVLSELKRNRLADESYRKLREERRRERLEAEWSNMTTAGTKGAVFNPATGKWLVFKKTSRGPAEN
jgi:hypothetical protein